MRRLSDIPEPDALWDKHTLQRVGGMTAVDMAVRGQTEPLSGGEGGGLG